LHRKGAARFEGLKDFPGLNLRGPRTRAPPATTDIAPEGTRFIAGTFRSADGSRNYKLFVPSRSQEKPLPLVVMLHGCTQSPDDFAVGTRMNFLAEERNCFVVYPEQPSGANQAKCWNWFRTGDQQRNGGEPSLIAGITRQVMRDYPIDLKRVYVAGLSAGGAAAAIMAATHPDLFAAVGIHSGLACVAASELPFGVRRHAAGAGLRSAMADRPFRPSFSTATATPRCIRTTASELSSGPPTRRARERGCGRVPRGHAYTRTIVSDAGGRAISEHWNIHGVGHAWSGGSPTGSYTDPRGPDARREMLRFFLDHSLPV
jgi:poly(3-hydroxybutyrate) depolymerase